MRTRPPQSGGSHDREPQRDGRERVGHGDTSGVVEDEVPRGCQLLHCSTDLFGRYVKLVGELGRGRRSAVTGKGGIDGHPYVFEFHKREHSAGTTPVRRRTLMPSSERSRCRTSTGEFLSHVTRRITSPACSGLRVASARPSRLSVVSTSSSELPEKDRQERILDAVLRLLATGGISAASMRAVSREAGVSLGLVNYYYEDKTSLIGAALRRIEEQDVAMVRPDPSLAPEARLRSALQRVADPEFLTTEYLSLRLQLWALAQAHEEFERINSDAQRRYRAGLAELIREARPDLTKSACAQRAADIDVVQNGLWLTALLGLDGASIRRSVRRCQEIALAE